MRVEPMEEPQKKIMNIKNVKVFPMMAVLLLGGFIALLNETFLNVALQKFMGEFHISAETAQWLTTGYMLAIGILVPVTAFLIQRFTIKQLYLTAISIFTIGTIIAGCSLNFSMLLTGRFVQALGTGALVPLMMNTILIINPPEKRGAAIGMGLLVILLAPGIGPTLSGLIIKILNWRWLFIIMLPLSVLSFVFGSIYLENVTELTNPRIDLLSILLSTVGFGGIIYGVGGAGENGLADPRVLVPIIIGFAGLLLFVRRQLSTEQPMLEMRVFKYPMFTLGAILIVVEMMIMFADYILLPMFLQGVLSMSSFSAGLVLLPGGLLNVAIPPISGRIYDKYGPRMVVVLGFIIMSTAYWLLSGISASSSIATIVILHCCLFIGVPISMTPVQTNGLNQLPPKYYPHGTAIINTLQLIAAALGSSMFIGLMSAGQRSYLKNINNPEDWAQKAAALVSGIKHAFTIGFVLLLIGLIISLFIKRKESNT